MKNFLTQISITIFLAIFTGLLSNNQQQFQSILLVVILSYVIGIDLRTKNAD